MTNNHDVFRKMYGDDLANQVEELKRKPSGVEVLKPRKQPEKPRERKQPEQDERWWDR